MVDPLPLSPAESLLLLNLKYSSRQAVKVTLLALMAQKFLRFETRTFGKEKVQYLHVKARHLPNAPAHVASLMDTPNSGQPGGMELDDVVTRLHNKYGNWVNSFKTDLVLPALVVRGLLVEERFGLFRFGRRLRLTPAGEFERKRIDAAVQKAREIPDLLKTAPAQAAAVALRVGSAILLVDRLTFLYRELGEAMRKHRDNGAGDTYDLENMDMTAVGALEYCLKRFEDTFRSGGGVA